ncbi:MAG TPA: hypothetical protein VFZ09_41405, partial [Archangium sp.]|nr:hypothetical protein [Archangium sp.]
MSNLYMKVNSRRLAGQGALALVLALVLPFASPAENGNEIRNHITSINRLYENLDYEVALSRIALARKLPRGADEEITLTLYEGILLYELGRHESSASSFRAALLRRPDSKLPVQVAPNTTVGLWREGLCVGNGSVWRWPDGGVASGSSAGRSPRPAAPPKRCS